MIPDPREHPLMTVAEVAEATDLPRGAVYRGIKDGTIPSRHFGRLVRVPTAELISWLGLSNVEPPDDDGQVVQLREAP